MRRLNWMESLRRSRRAARRMIRIRRPEYRHWSGPLAACELFEQRLVPTLTVSVSAMGLANGVATEGDSGTITLDYYVLLSGVATSDVTVPWSVLGTGTSPADAGDFSSASTSGSATITEGNSVAWISVSITGDTTVEPDETFAVTLGTPTGADPGPMMAASGTIINDDCAEITIGDATVTEGAR